MSPLLKPRTVFGSLCAHGRGDAVLRRPGFFVASRGTDSSRITSTLRQASTTGSPAPEEAARMLCTPRTVHLHEGQAAAVAQLQILTTSPEHPATH